MKLLIEIIFAIVALMILLSICIIALEMDISKKWSNIYKEGGKDD